MLSTLTSGPRGESRQADWLLYEDGQLARPLRVLTDGEVDSLLDQIHEQRDAARQRKTSALQIDGTAAQLRTIVDRNPDMDVVRTCSAAADLLEAAARGTELFTTKEKQ